ncbi:hypothetical protein BU107_13970 [Staphylococcus xylosus]|uniref:DsbA family protein n=1 Tax=Staphylococcus xylosus TaxID=1288 RepID=UPI000E6A04E9|nr:thioredoxin domain-containing protein [Staphylococcus xylosus]RIM82188.1 hypothetical protein BU107_13970 [Staphylococcus xylosus]
MNKKFLIIVLFSLLFISACGNEEHKKPEVVMYGDFKFINASILGDDSKLVSSAGQSVKMHDKQEYLEFQKLLYEKQPKDSGKNVQWVNNQILDNTIDKLNTNKDVKNKIKSDYKDRESKAWEMVKKDRDLVKKHGIKQVPTVSIDGKIVQDPYQYDSYKRLLK